MTARPFRTFQSEGLYRPGYARTDHYFRLTGTGDLPLVALCGRHRRRAAHRSSVGVGLRFVQNARKVLRQGALSVAPRAHGRPAPRVRSAGGDVVRAMLLVGLHINAGDPGIRSGAASSEPH